MEHRGIKRRVYISISIGLLIMLAECAPHDIASQLESYTPDEFAQFSRDYRKTVITKSGKEIHFSIMNIARDTVYLSEKAEEPSETAKAVPVSNVKIIDLAPRVSASFWSAGAGVAAGIGTSVILASGSHSFVPAISFAIIPPVLGFAGGMIGHGIDSKNAYMGYYQIISVGTNYILQPIK